jgi:peptide/nickel transport system permease protein
VTASVGPLVGRVSRRRIRRVATSDFVFWLCIAILVIVVGAAIFAPLIAPYPPNQLNLNAVLQSPSTQHWFGTDDLGRDIFSRCIYGGRLPLLGSALIVLIATATGTVLAMSTVWLGGWFDAVVGRGLDILFAFPGLLLAILAVAVFGAGFVAPVLALAIAYTPYMSRLIRSATIREHSQPYIAACSVQGFSGPSICLRHLLPNIFPFIVVQATVSFGYALIDLASLSYLGLGVQPPTADWGLMVSQGQLAILAHHPEQSLFAGLMIVLTVVAFVMAGERRGASIETLGQ